MIEAEIDRLIDLLDVMDAPDEELEPQGDEEPDADGEPELGWTDNEAKKGRYAHQSGTCDVYEAALGWSIPVMGSPEYAWEFGFSVAMVRLLNPEIVFSPVIYRPYDARDLHLGQGVGQDLEEQCEDEGAQCEDEGYDSDSDADLGWTFWETITGKYAMGWSSLVDTEADLGSLDGQMHQGNWSRGRDGEPSLAAPEMYHPGNQTYWARGSDDEQEHQCEDEGVDVDMDEDREGNGPADFGYPGPLDADGRDFLTGKPSCAGGF